MVQVMGEAWEESQGIQDRVEEAGVAKVGQGTNSCDPSSTVPQFSCACPKASTGLGGASTCTPTAAVCCIPPQAHFAQHWWCLQEKEREREPWIR